MRPRRNRRPVKISREKFLGNRYSGELAVFSELRQIAQATKQADKRKRKGAAVPLTPT